MKQFVKFLFSLVVMFVINMCMGSVFAQSVGINPHIGQGVLTAIGCMKIMPTGMCFSGVYTELWTGELIKKFRQTNTWLKRVRNMSGWVDHNVIHLVDLGADPEVLINNTTYPIPTVELVDGDVPISLDRFDTQNTRIRASDLHSASYDIIGTHVERHKLALESRTELKSIHSMAIPSNLDGTIMLRTTGEVVTDRLLPSRNRLALTPEDLATAHVELLQSGATGPFILLLNLQHTLDLLSADENFAKQYKNLQTGEVLPLFGFDIYPTANIPQYSCKDMNVLDDEQTKHSFSATTKVPFGASSPSATSVGASVFFPLERAVQALGTVDMYKREASQDPEGRANTIGFSMYHLCLPVSYKGFGAIIDCIDI